MLEKCFKISDVKHFTKWLVFHNVSLIYMLGTLVARGIMQVKGTDFAGLSHIAGLAHAMLGIALIWFVIILKKTIK